MKTRTTPRSVTTAVRLALLAAASLSGACASNSSDTLNAANTAPSNFAANTVIGQPADPAFVTTLIHRYEAALDLCKLEMSNGRRPEVLNRTRSLQSELNVELGMLRDHQNRLGAAPARTDADPSVDFDRRKLGALRGVEADQLFLERLVAQMQGNIALAQDARGRLQDTSVDYFASRLIDDKVRLVGELKQLTALTYIPPQKAQKVSQQVSFPPKH